MTMLKTMTPRLLLMKVCIYYNIHFFTPYIGGTSLIYIYIYIFSKSLFLGGPTREFLSEVWIQSSELYLNWEMEGKKLHFFACTGSYIMPLDDTVIYEYEKTRNNDFLKCAKVYYRAIGRIMAYCVLNGHAIANNVLVRLRFEFFFSLILPNSYSLCQYFVARYIQKFSIFGLKSPRPRVPSAGSHRSFFPLFTKYIIWSIPSICRFHFWRYTKWRSNRPGSSRWIYRRWKRSKFSKVPVYYIYR